MDKLLGLLSSLEAAIRYLLTGVVISAVILASQTEPTLLIKWTASNGGLAFGAILAAGFVSFILYRLIFWVVWDYLAWWVGASAPSLDNKSGMTYPKALSQFLTWRYSNKIAGELGGYLTYRWAISHFCIASAISLFVACCSKEQGSLLDQHGCASLWIAIFGLALGIFQCWFLSVVEREIYSENRSRR